MDFVYSHTKNKIKYYRCVAPGTLYWTNRRGIKFTFEIEVGWVTDFASVPWWATWLISQDGPYREAAILHDKALEAGWGRSDARDLFWDSLKKSEKKTGKIKTLIIFAAVWWHDHFML